MSLKGSLLVVDDDPSIIKLIKRSLELQGYRVEGASSGEEALERLDQESFDVVLLDVAMPGMDGVTVLKTLKGKSVSPEVIMMTGQSSLETVIQSLRSGAFDYLLKPFAVEEVRSAIDRALSQRELELLNAIAEFSRSVLSSNELFPLLEQFVERARHILMADNVSIMLLDKEQQLRIVAATGLPLDVVRNTKIALGERVAGKVALSRESLLLVNGLETYEDFKKLAVHRQIRSSIVHPLVCQNEVIGVMNISRVQRPHLFNVRDQKGADILGGYLAVAIQHARLYDRLTVQREEDVAKAYAELREAHAQLKAAQVYSVQHEKFSAIGRFAGTMAHNLRNPLQIIMSNAQSILKDASEKTAIRAAVIVEQAKQASRLIGEMLRTASPKDAVGHREPLAVGNEIDGVLKAASSRLEDRHVHVLVEDVDPSWRVFGDRLALEQVLMNLVMNAVDAMPEGGLLVVKGAKSPRPGMMSLRVQDTGLGMSPDHLQKLFQPFFTTKPEGIGLGLFSAKQVVEAHGGSLVAESAVGHGTTMQIELPLMPPGERDPSVRDPSSEGRSAFS